MYGEIDECVNWLRGRGVKYLVHFTPVDNLESIWQRGILPRCHVPQDAVCTDEDRWDRHTDCVCCSISHPNYPMLNRKYLGVFDREVEFALLYVDIEVLAEIGVNNVYFLPHNASSSGYAGSSAYGYTGLGALADMFSEGGSGASQHRSRMSGLRRTATTDVQAEVLIRGRILASYIEWVKVNDKSLVDYAKGIGFPRVCEDPYMYYGPRALRQWWKTNHDYAS